MVTALQLFVVTRHNNFEAQVMYLTALVHSIKHRDGVAAWEAESPALLVPALGCSLKTLVQYRLFLMHCCRDSHAAATGTLFTIRLASL
jgi:hypothetical protein